MHAKVSPLGTRYFAHDRRSPTCPAAGETPEHRQLKAALAALIRTAGGTAVIEATPGPGDTGGWRADVLGIGPAGHRVAFEVQLASMTAEVGRERSARYATDAIQTVWVSPRRAPWLYEIPGVQVDQTVDGMIICEGVAALRDGRWRVQVGAPLSAYVPLWLRGDMSHVGEVWLSEDRAERYLSRPGSVVCTTRAVVEQWERHLLHEADRRRRAEEEAAAHQANTKALYERQARLLQIVVPWVQGQLQAGERLWLGVPPTPWPGTIPVPLDQAYGSAATAQGAPVWTGQAKNVLAMRALISPVASRVSPSLAALWRKRAVTVLAETSHEAQRLARALGWPTDQVAVVGAESIRGMSLRPIPATSVAPSTNARSRTGAGDALATAGGESRRAMRARRAGLRRQPKSQTPEERHQDRERVLSQFLPASFGAAAANGRVFLGRERVPWDGAVPVRLPRGPSGEPAPGNAWTWVYIGPAPGEATLAAMVCPDPAQLDATSSRSLQERGIHVVVGSADQAVVVAARLGWDPAAITVLKPRGNPAR